MKVWYDEECLSKEYEITVEGELKEKHIDRHLLTLSANLFIENQETRMFQFGSRHIQLNVFTTAAPERRGREKTRKELVMWKRNGICTFDNVHINVSPN